MTSSDSGDRSAPTRSSRLPGSPVQRLIAWALMFVALAVAFSSSGIEGDLYGPPLTLAAIVSLVAISISSARNTTGSLRRQIGSIGLAAVILPPLALFFLLSIASSEEIGPATDRDPAEERELEDPDDPENDTVIDAPERDVGLADLPPWVAVTALVVTGCSGIALWAWSSRAVVDNMSAITDVANDIQAGSLDRRIGLEGANQEVQALADSFDLMLDRLDTASKSQRQLIEDASHELRTPLAALAINNEVMLNSDAPTLDEYRASAERNAALVHRLQTTLDDLVLGARHRTAQTRQVDNDLMAIIRRVTDQHRIVNPSVPIVVRGPGELRLGIDGPSIERALANLVENAARYSPPGVPVSIDVTMSGNTASLSVTDHGTGIGTEETDDLFERYHQNDDVGEPGSAGIGLAMVKQVADAHGRIEVTSPLPGDTKGTRFTMVFDRAVDRPSA